MQAVIKLYDQNEQELYYESPSMCGFGLKDSVRNEAMFTLNMAGQNVQLFSQFVSLKVQYEVYDINHMILLQSEFHGYINFANIYSNVHRNINMALADQTGSKLNLLYVFDVIV